MWISILGWIVALIAVGAAGYVWWARPTLTAASAQPALPTPLPSPIPDAAPPDISIPAYSAETAPQAVSRQARIDTQIPNRPRSDVITVKVDVGDSLFGLADNYGVEPETVLWANYDILEDNPDQLAPGMELFIPPVDGVYYKWEDGDNLVAVAEDFEAEPEDILNFIGNNVDLANPTFETGQYVMIPEGRREFRKWLVPTIARENAGVSGIALGPGSCSGSFTGLYGSGAFIWPTGRRFVSGNDYWSGHLALDLAAVQGDPIAAADAGVVVFAGWANGGYGYMVMVDHGNGYQTLYAHLSSVNTSCGASVRAGTTIGLAGSTGNSTGAHLHFEVRLGGGFINPWFVLPAP